MPTRSLRLAGADFEGDPRPLGPGPDIGFDESGATSPPNARFYLPLILKNWHNFLIGPFVV
jgi:hypothetical protein